MTPQSHALRIVFAMAVAWVSAVGQASAGQLPLQPLADKPGPVSNKDLGKVFYEIGRAHV